MSVDTVMSRVQALQALITPPVPKTPPASTNGSSFAAQLSSAQGASGLGAATPVAPAAGGGSTPYDAEIAAAASRLGIDPALLKGLIRQESNFNPNAGSPAGAQGLCQLMPGTAAALGVTNPMDPAQSIEGGAKYLKQQLDAFGGDVTKALAAYNAGPGAVQKHGGVPPFAETQNYVRQVQAYAAGYRSAPAAASAAPPISPSMPTPAPAPAAAGSLPYSTT